VAREIVFSLFEVCCMERCATILSGTEGIAGFSATDLASDAALRIPSSSKLPFVELSVAAGNSPRLHGFSNFPRKYRPLRVIASEWWQPPPAPLICVDCRQDVAAQSGAQTGAIKRAITVASARTAACALFFRGKSLFFIASVNTLRRCIFAVNCCRESPPKHGPSAASG
jgi:hypothetical protein